MRKIYHIIALAVCLFTANTSNAVLTTVIGPGGGATGGGNFDFAGTLAANNWGAAGKLVSPSTDGWCLGNVAVPFSAANCAYVSTNPGAATPYAYSASAIDTLILYRTNVVTFPANNSCITLNFQWKCTGESGLGSDDNDNFKVFFIPKTVAVPINTNDLNSQYKIGQVFYNQGGAGWNSVTINLDPRLAGNGVNYILAFAWYNDGDGTAVNPPAAIDDVLLTYDTPTAIPTPCPVYNAPANGSTGLTPCSVTLDWNPVGGCNGATVYNVYFGTVSPGAFAGTITSTTMTFSGLAPSTTYYWHIEPANSFGNNVFCAPLVYSFTTGTNPVVLTTPPFLDNFEGCNLWTTYNAATNQWVRGTAVSAGGIGAMYISNNGGASNTYTNTLTTISHFSNNPATVPYFDLTGVAAGQCVNLSFDWRAAGETGFDWLEVWKVPVGFVPTAGVAITASASNVLIAGPLNINGSFQNFSTSLSAFVGTQFKLVFTWRNDGSLGAQPPAAVDNIAITLSGSPANDSTYNATFLPMSPGGIIVTGNNSCANNNDEPFNSTATDPTCWVNATNAQLNAVWYRFVAPSYLNPCVKIKTEIGTLDDTQIAVYRTSSGTPLTAPGQASTAGQMILIGCSDDRTGCGTAAAPNSEVILSGGVIQPGQTYYIAVDGKNAKTGTFKLFIMDGGAGCVNSLPLTPTQDCGLAQQVTGGCSINVPNPGYRNFGTVCDIPTPSACLGSGEKFSAWYRIDITGVGGGNQLMFDIIPNDYPASPTDYDFILFRLDNTIPYVGDGPADGLDCSELYTLGPANNIRCNYSAQQVTGCYVGGNSPPTLPGFNGAYELPVTVNVGESYVLMVSNFAPGAAAGFALNFGYSTCTIGGTLPIGTNVFWTGQTSSDWNTSSNWSSCIVPSCVAELNAIISAPYVNAPVISAAASCRDLYVYPSASVSITGTGSLDVCRDYNNQGTLNAAIGSVVRFNGPTTGSYQNSASYPPARPANGYQYLDGAMTGANAFHNVEVIKSAATAIVKANLDVDNRGNFYVGQNAAATANNVTSFFDIANKYHKVGGNFWVYSTGATTSTYNPPTTLEFTNASGLGQTYNNRGTLNSVFMNHAPASSLTLLNHGLAGTAYMNLGAAGVLTLTSGKILTANVANGYIYMANNNPAAITAGNATSYIEGFSNVTMLRKAMTGAVGTYEFPLGVASKGYNRLTLNITTAFAPVTTYFNATFNTGVPATPTAAPQWTECGITYHTGGLTPLNHGWWQLQTNVVAAVTTGRFDVSLYNNGYTNSAGANGWSVMYSRGSNTAAGWNLTPVPASPCFTTSISPTIRQNLFANAVWGTTGLQQGYFGTSQSQNPLPVELLSFDAIAYATAIETKWTTASELNNKGFEVERGLSPGEFKKIGWVDGFGTSNKAHDYNFIDRDVMPNTIYYYRLKQVDFNGEFSYSPIVAASIKDNTGLFVVSPNPYSGKTNISYILSQSSEISIEVMNSLGQKVATLYKGQQDAGNYTYHFGAKQYGFAAGVYTVRMIVNDKVYTQRLFEKD